MVVVLIRGGLVPLLSLLLSVPLLVGRLLLLLVPLLRLLGLAVPLLLLALAVPHLIAGLLSGEEVLVLSAAHHAASHHLTVHLSHLAGSLLGSEGVVILGECCLELLLLLPHEVHLAHACACSHHHVLLRV